MSAPRKKRTRIHSHKVARVLILKGDHVLLSQRALSGKQPGSWELVGGGVDKGESREEAALRETLEEIGVHVRIKQTLIRDHIYRVHRSFQIKTTLFLAELIDESEPFVLDPEEVEQVAWFDFDHLPENINSTTLEVILAAFKKD